MHKALLLAFISLSSPFMTAEMAFAGACTAQDKVLERSLAASLKMQCHRAR